MKSWKYILSLTALIVGFCSFSEASSSRKASGLSVIVAPSNYTVLQVAFDLADQYPALIVSYEDDGNAADPFMHVWNGSSWRPLSFESYASGNFLAKRPSQVLVIGDDSGMSETLLARSEGWGSQAYILPKAPLRELLNQVGQRFDFGKREWFYFAERYKLSVIDLNEEKRSATWYDGRMLKDSQGGAAPRAIPAPRQIQSTSYNTTTTDLPPIRSSQSVVVTPTPVVIAAPAAIQAPATIQSPTTIQAPANSAITSIKTIRAPVVTDAVAVEATTVDTSLPAVRFSTEAYDAKAATTTTTDGLPEFKGWDKSAIKADSIK